MQSEIVLRFLCGVLIAFAGPISASHFRGAIFAWKPGSNPGNIIIGYRISWRMSYGHQVFCNNTFTKQEKSVDGEGNLECFDNCRSGSNTLGQLSYKCTDYSVNEDWSSGRGQISHTFVSEKHPPSSVFKFGFRGNAWIDTLVVGGGKWVLRATADLLPRRDNGKINSSPIAEIPPIIRLQHGCNHTIRIGVVDPDKDILRCRWATASNDECGGICQTLPNALIHASECTVTYNAVYQTGLYAVAIQVEDYLTANSPRPLSSVPVQFLVNVYQSSDTCTAKTEFVEPTPPDNACIAVHNGDVYESAIVTRRTSNSTRISEIKTVSPLGLSKSSLYRVNETDWRMNITFTPVPGGDQSNMFCFAAEDARGFESNERCITLIVGVSPPRFIDGLPSGTVDQSQRRWILTADSIFTQATRQSGFIRMYNRTGHLVEAINTSDRNAVIFHTEYKRLEFVTTTKLTQREEYYFLIDPGIVKGSVFCGLESEGINDPTFWKIRIRGTAPPSVAITKTLPGINSTIEEFRWKVDELVIVSCNLTSPSNVVTQTSCDSTCIDTSHDDGNYSFLIHASDIDGNQATQTHSWTVGNCDNGTDVSCYGTRNICIRFNGIVSPLYNSTKYPPQPPVVELKAGNGFSSEPVELFISARNLSGYLDDISIYIYGVPADTSFTRGIVLNDSTLLLHSSDFGKINMTTTSEGEYILTVIVIQHFEFLNVTKTGELRLRVYPKLKDIDIQLNGCFSEDLNGEAVALLNSSVVFGNKLLDYPCNTSLIIPKMVSLIVPLWVQPFGTSGGSGEYEIETNLVDGMLELNSRYEPLNVSVYVSINPKGLSSSVFSKSTEILRPCIGECDKYVFGVGCNRKCSCEWRNTISCDNFNGSCLCLPSWRGTTCKDFACPCVVNQTELCEPVSQTCQCKDGWTGPDCDKDINECLDFSACDKFSNTGCQNSDWGYDCLCLVGYQLRNNSCVEITQTENNEMPGESLINTTALPLALEQETQIILHINIDIPNTDNLEVAVTYEKYKRKATVMLTNVYSEQLGDNFISVIVNNVSAGSLVIDHTVVTKDDVEAKQDLAVTVYHMVQNTITLEFGNQNVTVKEVFVDASKVTSACDAYWCENTECTTERNRPYCRALDEHSINYAAIMSSVSAAIVAIMSIIGVVYKYKTGKEKKYDLECVKGQYDNLVSFTDAITDAEDTTV